ncbi:hypothetical protein RHOER0001_1679 [Rhodococcus erythropolis SK121]|nr:hypothetical protein RHOER0001_1679 [Rhodococcus erythropolis SK121]
MFGSDPPKRSDLVKGLGTDVFTRDISRGPRELTPTGTSLQHLVLANIDRLRKIASYEPARPK